MEITLPISKETLDITNANSTIIKKTVETLSRNLDGVPFIFRSTKKFVEDLNISHLPFKDVEYAILIRMALSNIDTKLVTKGICEECKHVNKTKEVDVQDLAIGDDTETTKTVKMFSEKEMKNVLKKLNIESKESYEKRIKSTVEKGLVSIKNNIDELVVKSMTFNIPTLDDLVSAETHKPDNTFNNVLKHTIVGMEFSYNGSATVESYQDVVDRFGYDLFNFTLPEYNTKVVSMWNNIGMMPYVDFTCSECGHNNITTFDFSSFFVFGILHSQGKR